MNSSGKLKMSEKDEERSIRSVPRLLTSYMKKMVNKKATERKTVPSSSEQVKYIQSTTEAIFQAPLRSKLEVKKVDHNSEGVEEKSCSTPSVALKTLHLDHQYLSPLLKDQNRECKILPKQETRVYSIKIINRLVDSVDSNVTNCQGNDKNLRIMLSGTDEFIQQRVNRALEFLGKTQSCKSSETSVEPEVVPSIPNAAAIQNSFQDMLKMTAFQSISDSAKLQPFSENAFDIVGNKNTETFQNEEDYSKNATSNQFNNIPLCSVNVTSIPDRNKLQRNLNDNIMLNSLLNHAMQLMMQRWAEYLNFTPEELYELELQNARELNSAPEVIEMLEDRGRYVWQLIENL